jgi:hypothetical protein
MGTKPRRARPAMISLGGQQGGADHVRGGLVNATPGRRVARVEETLPGQ